MTDPVPEDLGPARRRTVLVTAVGALVAAALLFAVVTRISTTASTPAGGGAAGERVPRFELGRATDHARTIARDGPLLFPDPQGQSRDIFVQHLGGDEWLAFEARAAGASRQCVLRWEHAARHFVDPCDGRIYPPDGEGLVGFPTTVNDEGTVVVDLSGPAP